MRTRHWAGWVVVGVIGAASCTGTGGASTARSCPPPEPTDHRASAGACPLNPTTEKCSTDADCTSTSMGKCAGGLCNYDECTTDADCGASGAVCGCAGQPYSVSLSESPPGNVCFPGDCRVDADCGPGFFCSPSFSTCPNRVLKGFHCHTCEDGCINDSDCPASDFDCTFEPSHGGWVCQYCGGP
jgi:hypothetical protein